MEISKIKIGSDIYDVRDADSITASDVTRTINTEIYGGANKPAGVSNVIQHVNSLIDTALQNANAHTINKTWAEMIALKNSNGFIPGQTYRITDYVTAGKAETNIARQINGYAGHPFDIIVTALTVNTLDEDARAALHEGDTYFADCKLEAWRLKYILDPANDPRKPHYGNSSASPINSQSKGWIYFMEDEHLNSANYDFKNILTKGVKVTDFKHKDWVSTNSNPPFKGDVYVKYIMQSSVEDDIEGDNNEVFKGLYTINPNSTKLFYLFSYLNEDGSVIDASVKGVDGSYPYANRMSEIGVGSRSDESENLNPNINIFLCDWEWTAANGLGLPAHNNFGQRTYNNTFGNRFVDNVFYHRTNNSVFGNSVSYNVMSHNVNDFGTGNHFLGNSVTGDIDQVSVGNLFYHNTAHDIKDVTFGNRTTFNEIRTLERCTIGSEFVENRLSCGVIDSTFGDSFMYNAGEGTVDQMNIGDTCHCNIFDNSTNLTMGNSCSYNRFSTRCGYITMGNSCSNNVFEGGDVYIYMGDHCNANYFEKNVRYIVFGSSVNDLKGYYYAVMIGPYNDHITLNCTATTSTSNRFMGIKVDARVYSPYFNNTSTTNHPYKVIENSETEQNYTTTYANSNSRTVNV